MVERLKAIWKLRELYGNGRELSDRVTTDTDLQVEIKVLTRYFLGRELVGGCGNCYFDALLQLLILTEEQVMDKMSCDFKLIGGKLLLDVVNQDISKAVTQANLTEDLALYHLKTNPNCKEYFEELPADWEERVENYNIEDFGKTTNSEQELSETEKNFVNTLVKEFKSGMSKTKIADKFKGTIVGDEPISNKKLKELINKALLILSN